MAIAVSKTTAALGYVICDNAKNEEVPRSTYRAHRDWRYNPKAAVIADQIMTKVPSNMPICEIAKGLASTPAPITTDNVRPMLRCKESGGWKGGECFWFVFFLGGKEGGILVFTRFIILLSHEACPAKPPSFKDRLKRRLCVQVSLYYPLNPRRERTWRTFYPSQPLSPHGNCVHSPHQCYGRQPFPHIQSAFKNPNSKGAQKETRMISKKWPFTKRFRSKGNSACLKSG